MMSEVLVDNPELLNGAENGHPDVAEAPRPRKPRHHKQAKEALKSGEEALKELHEAKLAAKAAMWRATGPYTHKAVVEALVTNNLNEKVAKEFQPRKAFTRALRKLEKEG